jgi:uncharacterized protein with FMN-binding domain
MKKYLQISVVLGAFFILVFIRQLRSGGSNEAQVVGNSSQSSQTNSSQNTPTAAASAGGGKYKNGPYTGSVEDAYYGNLQVQVQISNGSISDVTFLQYPNDNHDSQFINSQAMPILKSEAIQAQSANVDIVSGASDSSQAFQKSLQTALQQAS